LRSNIKGYGGKTHYNDSQNNDKTARSGRELYLSLNAVSPENFGYTLVFLPDVMLEVEPQMKTGLASVFCKVLSHNSRAVSADNGTL
jgi:hypothetical protein